MTRRTPNNHARLLTTGLHTALTLALAGTLAGCGGGNEAPPEEVSTRGSNSDAAPARPARPAPTPTAPAVRVDLARVIENVEMELGRALDARVEIPEELAPTDEGLATRIVLLADAIATHDHQRVIELLPAGQRAAYEEAMAAVDPTSPPEIEAVRLVYLDQISLGAVQVSGSTASIPVLAIQLPGGASVAPWQATRTGGEWFFGHHPSGRSDLVLASARAWDSQLLGGDKRFRDYVAGSELSTGIELPDEAPEFVSDDSDTPPRDDRGSGSSPPPARGPAPGRPTGPSPISPL